MATIASRTIIPLAAQPPNTTPDITLPIPLPRLCLDSKPSLREVRCVLLVLLRYKTGLVLRKASANRACLLWPQVEGRILLALVKKTQLLALRRVDNGESAGDGLADVVAGGF